MEVLLRWDFGSDVFEGGIATTQEEIEATLALRYHGYVEQNKTVRREDLDLLDQIRHWEQDEHDTIHAVYLLGTHNGKPIATVRLLLCDKHYILETMELGGKPFEFPSVHPATGEPVTPEMTAESTRWVAPSVTLGDGLVVLPSFLMTAVTMKACMKLGRKFLICDINKQSVDRLSDNGWHYDLLWPEVIYRGKMQLRVVIYHVRDYPTPRTLRELGYC